MRVKHGGLLRNVAVALSALGEEPELVEIRE